MSEAQRTPGRSARGGRRSRQSRPAPPAASRCSAGSTRAPAWPAQSAAARAADWASSGQPASAAEALRELDRLSDGEAIAIANRGGFSAWIGGAGWAGLEPGASYLFTVEAVRRLVAQRDQVVKGARWAPGAGIVAMWQTILNGFTFGRNVALGALGRGTGVPAEQPWQRRLDAFISVVVAIPALLVAVPLELIAAALRRGGAVSLRVELL